MKYSHPHFLSLHVTFPTIHKHADLMPCPWRGSDLIPFGSVGTYSASTYARKTQLCNISMASRIHLQNGRKGQFQEKRGWLCVMQTSQESVMALKPEILGVVWFGTALVSGKLWWLLRWARGTESILSSHCVLHFIQFVLEDDMEKQVQFPKVYQQCHVKELF